MQTFNPCEAIGADEELFDPKAFEVFNPIDAIAVEREHTQLLVVAQTVDLGDLVIVKVQILQI